KKSQVLNFEVLQDYLENRMKMQHIYQPTMIRTLLKSKNVASVEAIARSFLQDDTSQIDYYIEIAKNMPGKVLRKNKVVEYKDGKFMLISPDFTDNQRQTLMQICNHKISEYEKKFGEKIWIHRARSSRIITGSNRYNVLKNAKSRCADFRLWHGMYEKKEKNCIFCKLDKIEIENSLAFALKDKYPVTSLHYLVMPKRHISSFFELGSSEQKACLNLLEDVKRKILEKDKTVTGFNVGINIGKDAGQTIFHCHIHLIPRRIGDVSNPEGGVRNIISEKGKWK
ncbi:MAG: family hydrolase, partial [Nitrosarchaeum sp.]|nr:family hydrolase [Nitrosarchaeum sp.]